MNPLPSLPDKLSDLLQLALDDAAVIAKDPRYRLQMYEWHSPKTSEKGSPVCEVCLGGSVLANTLKFPVDVFWWANEDHPLNQYAEDPHIGDSLLAINAFRVGRFRESFHRKRLIPKSIQEELYQERAGRFTIEERRWGHTNFPEYTLKLIEAMQGSIAVLKKHEL